MAPRAGDLVRNDAKELAAESEQHLATLTVSMFPGNEHDTAGQARQPFERRSPADHLGEVGWQRCILSKIWRQIIAAIHSSPLRLKKLSSLRYDVCDKVEQAG